MNDSGDTTTRPPAGFDSPSFDGLETEHILIEDELSAGDATPQTVADRRIINNRIRGIVTELTLYEEGFLRVREGTTRNPLKNHLIEIQFLDPDFHSEWRFAKAWLWLLLVALAATTGAWFLIPLVGHPDLLPVGVAAGGLFSAAVFYRLLRNTRETLTFFTASGRATVLMLDANIGCLRTARKAARAISRAIEGTGASTGSFDVRKLRAEMQAHYRLLEKGVISKDACSRSTAQILAKFG